MRPSAFRFFFCSSLLITAGCGLVLGLEDHELDGLVDNTSPIDDATPTTTDGNTPQTDAAVDTKDELPTVPFDGDLPDAATIVTLATGQTNARGLALDDTHVYWVNSLSPNGTAMRVPKDGGEVETVGSGAGLPVRAALDNTYAYWTASNGVCAGVRGVWRRAKSGGQPERLFAADSLCPTPASLTTINDLSVDSTFAYWTARHTNPANSSSVYRVTTAALTTDGGATVIADLTSPNAYVATSADGLFFSDGSNLKRYLPDGGSSTLATTSSWLQVGIQVAFGYVYYATNEAIYRVPTGGGTGTQLGPRFPALTSFAVTATHAFVAVKGDPSIVKVAIDTGEVTPVLSGEDAVSIVVDDASIYWASSLGYVRKRPLP